MGRENHVDGLFVKLAQREIRSEAYRALSAQAVRALVELEMNYWETSRLNPMTLTQRWLAHRLGIDPKTAATIIDELTGHWFLDVERLGRITGPNNQRGGLYRMTWLRTSDGAGPTFDSRKWTSDVRLLGVGKIGASTSASFRSSGGRKGGKRTEFRHVGISAKEMIEKAQAARNQGSPPDDLGNERKSLERT